MTQDSTLKYQIKKQKFGWALRQAMGYPLFTPANDCTAFAGGGIADFVKGTEIARLATQMRKDVIYSAWGHLDDAEPTAFGVALREMLQVRWVDGLFPWAANDTSPIVLVSTRNDEHIAVGPRGLLERRAGKPAKALGAGKKLAKQRIRSAAATMRDQLAADNVFLQRGEEWREQSTLPRETIVRFG